MKILSCANSTNCFCCWTLLLIYDLYYSAYLQISILSTFVISARADVSGPPRANSECTLIILLLIWGFRLVGTWGSGGDGIWGWEGWGWGGVWGGMRGVWEGMLLSEAGALFPGCCHIFLLLMSEASQVRSGGELDWLPHPFWYPILDFYLILGIILLPTDLQF